MAELDPELRDKIIETHTMVGVIVKEHDEHKAVMNGRLKVVNEAIKDHGERITKTEHFRTKVVAFISVFSFVAAFAMDFTLGGIKKILGF